MHCCMWHTVCPWRRLWKLGRAWTKDYYARESCLASLVNLTLRLRSIKLLELNRIWVGINKHYYRGYVNQMYHDLVIDFEYWKSLDFYFCALYASWLSLFLFCEVNSHFTVNFYINKELFKGHSWPWESHSSYSSKYWYRPLLKTSRLCVLFNKQSNHQFWAKFLNQRIPHKQ